MKTCICVEEIDRYSDILDIVRLESTGSSKLIRITHLLKEYSA
jgi:hypothetical protein